MSDSPKSSRKTSLLYALLPAFLALSCFIPARPCWAQNQKQQMQQMQSRVEQLEQEVKDLKERLAVLERAQSTVVAPAPRLTETVHFQVAGPQYQRQSSDVPARSQEKNTASSQSASAQSGATAATQMKEISAAAAAAQDAPPQPPPQGQKVEKPETEIYGHAMLDFGYDANQIDPNWFDVMRPTKLPSVPNEFGQDGRLFAGVRQTRFGIKSLFPTRLGQLKTVFEFELFGVGNQAGETNFRLRQAYGELGQFLAGQTWSPFMDPDVFPNSIEYWGPNGMVFFRNVQFRWQPINNGNKQVIIALERPGASADLGRIQDRDIIQDVQFRFPAPDVSGRVRYGGKRTYLQLAGMFRYIAWDDNTPTATTDISGHTYGWGVHGSSNVGVGEKDTVKMSLVYGHGVENYMNDAPVDVAPRINFGNARTPIAGDALPVLGVVAFYDHYWNEKWSSSAGYSLLNISNAPLQLPNAFHRGHYALGDLLYYPVKNVMVGGELIWGRRENFADGFSADDFHIQFSFKYNFSYKIGGAK